MPTYEFKNTETDEVFEKFMSYDDKVKFLEDNAWEPFEDYAGKDIYQYIWQLANDIIMKRVPEEVEE